MFIAIVYCLEFCAWWSGLTTDPPAGRTRTRTCLRQTWDIEDYCCLLLLFIVWNLIGGRLYGLTTLVVGSRCSVVIGLASWFPPSAGKPGSYVCTSCAWGLVLGG